MTLNDRQEFPTEHIGSGKQTNDGERLYNCDSVDDKCRQQSALLPLLRLLPWERVTLGLLAKYTERTGTKQNNAGKCTNPVLQTQLSASSVSS